MMTAYFIFKEDLEGLTNCHAKFQACEELEIGDSTVRESSRALHRTSKGKKDNLCIDFLNSLNLETNWNRPPPALIGKTWMAMFGPQSNRL